MIRFILAEIEQSLGSAEFMLLGQPIARNGNSWNRKKFIQPADGGYFYRKLDLTEQLNCKFFYSFWRLSVHIFILTVHPFLTKIIQTF